jgi:hypothetical protein
MKRKNIFLIILLLAGSQLAFSQHVELQIDTLRISSIKRNPTEVYEILHEDGPVVMMIVSIENNSDSTVILKPSKARYFIAFNFDGEHYQQETFPLAFMDNEKIQLIPRQTIQFYVADNLFIGTPIYSEGKADYSNDLLRTLPTLKFKYRDANVSVETSNVKFVELPDY